MTDYTLIKGDCLEVMPTLAKGSVAMVFADLPYGIVRRDWDKPVNINSLWACLRRTAKTGARYIFTATLPFAASIIAAQPRLFRYDLVWDKRRSTGFLNAKQRPLRRHELVLVFADGKGLYNAQKTQGKPYSIRGRPADLNYMDNVKNDHVRTYDGERYPTSILTLTGRREEGLHPTQKPVALLEWLIATYTNPGDLVLDPVFGSNTTGVACARLGRRYIGIEKDPAFFAAGKARLEAEHARLAQQPAQSALAI